MGERKRQSAGVAGGEHGKFGGGVAGARRVSENAPERDTSGVRGLFGLGRENRRPRLSVASDQNIVPGEAHARDDRLL